MAITKDTGYFHSSEPDGKKLILGIGINTYKSKDWKPLFNAVSDVEKISELLLTQYGFDDAIILKNADATSENIENQLYAFTNSNILHPEDSLLIYYSGHGHLDHNDKGYWVTADARRGNISTYLANARIRELISDIKCKHLLLISDSCFSGSFFSESTRSDTRDATSFEDEYEKRISRWAFCSGRHDEVVSDGHPGRNSPFAEAILQELNLNSRKKLNIARLADKVTEITRSNYPQMPEANPIQNAGHKGGQFVFTKSKHAVHEKQNFTSIPSVVQLTSEEKVVKEPVSNVPQFKKMLPIVSVFLLLSLIGAFIVLKNKNSPTQKAIIELKPKIVALDSFNLGLEQSFNFTLNNIGNTSATIDSISRSSPEIVIYNFPKVISPQQSWTIKGKWKPKTAGEKTAYLLIYAANVPNVTQVELRCFVVKPEAAPSQEIKTVQTNKPDKPSQVKNTNKPAVNTGGTSHTENPVIVDTEPVETTITVETDVPPSYEMWLITEKGKKYPAKSNGKLLMFELPKELDRKTVTIYMMLPGQDTQSYNKRIGKDPIYFFN